MRRPHLLSILLIVLAALPVAAQHPNVERGFAPGQSFQIGDIDHVNLFNGSLVITIPLGPTYPVGGGLSYGLTLTYSSGVWDFREADGGETPLPSRTSNAGLGWRVSLGRYLPWSDPDNDRQVDLYIGPDGVEHWLYKTLHAGDADDPGDGAQPYQQTVQYTRDGSYLRAKKLSGGGWIVEFPDGQIHSFDTTGRLVRMEDRFGNYVNVTYGANSWTLTDKHLRSQTIQFQALWHGGSWVSMIDWIELTAFGAGNTALYDFSYTQANIRRACATSNLLPLTTDVQLLSSVSLPDGSSYQMPEYVTSASTDCRSSGVISSMVLPTLGRLEWTWQRYQFPTGSSPKAPPWRYTAGVASRAVRYPDDVLEGAWSYQTSLTPDGFNGTEKELVNTVTDPLGHRTVNYFSVAPEPSGTWSPHDYSLPFTRSVGDGAGRFLSARVYNAAGTLLRSSYVRYERDQTWTAPDLQDKGNLNRREASRRTVYEDDGASYADVTLSNFDGLGHYRRSETGGNFGSGNFRVSTIGYNPNAGTYELDANGTPKAGFTMVASTGRWLLNLYWDRVVSDGAAGEQDLNCFDGTTGFLTGRRVLRTPGAMSANDVLVLYEKDSSGNVSAETFYGGDPGGLSTTSPCASVAGSQYRLVHTWQSGALATSKYDTASFYSVRRDIDARTGLPSADYDTADLKTTYEYDSMGRRTWEIPSTGHGGQTEYVYSQAVSATDLADVLIRRRANGTKAAAVLSQNQILFDPLGRVWREQRKLPDGTWSIQETLYDGAGNKASVSEAQVNNPSSKTQFLSYDPFGRPGTIRPPDGFTHDVTITYAGVRSVSRTVKIGTTYNASNGTVTESSSITTELYDRQGRLWKVTEPSGAAGADVSTTYTYDTRDRLRGVSTTAGATTQTRSFVYDPLGFLRSETHPEKGLAGNGTVSYSDYDARGHFRQKTDVDTDLRYTYDRAERLATVKRANGTALKAFTYDTCSGATNWCKGKLVKAERFNYPVIGSTTFTALITETYTHGGRDGRVSQRDTQLSLNGTAGESFTQTFTWYHLGTPQQIGYPQCTHTGCATTAASPRTVENTFSEGLLASVKVGTLTYGSINYHPNLLVSQVTHANGITETQALDPNHMRRPAGFTATLGTTTLWSSSPYVYDGAGNITKTGASWYLYDKVGRLVSASLYDGTTGGGALKTQTYTFDPFGNMTAIGGTSARTTPTSAGTNRLIGAGVVYDARGNLTNWNGAVYDYDDFNQMKRMLSGAEEWIYVYTAGDERVWMKRVGYGFARWTLRDLEGTVLREYTQDTAGWSATSDYLYRDGQLLAAETSAGRKHFHLDHLGTPRLVTNASGQKLAYHLYYPFGEEATAFNQDAERMKFTGHERDLASAAGAGDDLDYMRARHCSPVTGRFLSVDPSLESVEAREPQSWNRFSYVQNRSMTYIDPSGAVLVFVGSDSNLQQVQQVINSSLNGYALVIGKNGVASLVVVPSQGKTSPKQAAFASILKGIVEQKATVTIGVTAGDSQIIFGQFLSGRIDISDIAKAGKEPGGSASILAHEFVEQTAKQTLGLPSDASGYTAAHPFGMAAQNIVSGYQRGPLDPSGTFSPATGNGTVVRPHTRGNQTVVVTFHWSNGNMVKVSRR